MKTVSLELAKQLKEAGFPQESTWHYGYNPIDPNKELTLLLTVVKPNALEWYATPTAEEILERLPDGTKIRKQPDFYSVSYAWSEKPGEYEKFTHQSLSEALGILWLYLQKNKRLS